MDLLIAVVKKKRDVAADDHAPKTSDDVLLDSSIKSDFRSWLAAPGGGCGLATASVGAGLSTLVRLFVRELDFDAVWIQAGTKNAPDALKDAGAFDVAPTGRRKIIVIDEFDAADKQLVVEYSKRGYATKLLCLAHSTRSAKTFEFAAKWARFEFPKVGADAINEALRAAGLVPTKTFVDGDVRAAFRACTHGTTKDNFRDGLDVVDSVLTGTTMDFREILRVYAADPAVVSMGIFENYLGACTTQQSVRVSDAFSVADAVDTAMYRTQNWGLQDIHGAMTVGVPAVELRKNTKNVRVKKFGTVWSRMYNAKAKSKNIKEINMKRLANGESHLAAEDLAFQRQILSCVTDEKIPDACGCLGESQVSMLMRLGFVPYKHDRIKKLLR